MRAFVVYDSAFGNTEKIAQAIASGIAAETSDGQVRLTRAQNASPSNVGGFDLLVVGCPTQAWRPTGMTRTFLENLKAVPLVGKRAAAFDTGFSVWYAGSAARRIARALRRQGCALVVPPERFLVMGTEGPLAEGELERAAAWGREIARAAGRSAAA